MGGIEKRMAAAGRSLLVAWPLVASGCAGTLEEQPAARTEQEILLDRCVGLLHKARYVCREGLRSEAASGQLDCAEARLRLKTRCY